MTHRWHLFFLSLFCLSRLLFPASAGFPSGFEVGFSSGADSYGFVPVRLRLFTGFLPEKIHWNAGAELSCRLPLFPEMMASFSGEGRGGLSIRLNPGAATHLFILEFSGGGRMLLPSASSRVVLAPLGEAVLRFAVSLLSLACRETAVFFSDGLWFDTSLTASCISVAPSRFVLMSRGITLWFTAADSLTASVWKPVSDFVSRHGKK